MLNRKTTFDAVCWYFSLATAFFAFLEEMSLRGAVVLLKLRGGSLIQSELYLFPFVVSLDVQDVFWGASMILLLDLNIYKGIHTFLWTQHGMIVVLPVPKKPLRRCCVCSSDLMAAVLVETALRTPCK